MKLLPTPVSRGVGPLCLCLLLPRSMECEETSESPAGREGCHPIGSDAGGLVGGVSVEMCNLSRHVRTARELQHR